MKAAVHSLITKQTGKPTKENEMPIKDIETLEIDGSRHGLEAMTLDDVICLEVENGGEFINGFYTEEEARQLRDWLNRALESPRPVEKECSGDYGYCDAHGHH